jgi:hypothetical protein
MSKDALSEFIHTATTSWKLNLALFLRLPAAFFSGVRLREMSGSHAVATVPFKWLTQNPFRSTYFASQAMAAEFSTGMLAMAHLHGRDPKVSMLVVHIEADFHKKATARTAFTCHDGDAMREAIEKAASGEPTTFIARSEGRGPQGELCSEFRITWSFKAKS